MIQAFVGLVGGGKSFCSVRRMCSYMAQGGRCASNIKLTGWDDKTSDLSSDSPVRPFLASLGWNYQPRQYVYIPYDEMVANPLWYEKIPQGESRDRRTLCVVDEATDLFDTLDGGKLRTDGGYRQLFHFLRLSRHAHIDVLFVCQDINSINSRLRALVSNIWRSTDMRNFKVGIFRFGFPVDCFMLQLFDRTGKIQIQREFVRKDKRVFGIYQSETFGGCLGVKWDGVSVNRESGKIRKVIPKMTLPYKIAFFALLGLSLFLLYRDLSRPSDELVPSLLAVSNEVQQVRATVASLRGYGGNHSPHNSKISNKLPPATDKAQASSRAFDTPVSPVAPVAPSKPLTARHIRGSYDFGQAGKDTWVYFDGALIRKGCPSEFGTAVLIDKYFTACVDDEGNTTYLLPFDFDRYNRQRRVATPSARFTSSADVVAPRPWYYAHTGTEKDKVGSDE